MAIDPNVKRRLASQVSQGLVVLFTGAGFSRSAKNHEGRPLPSGAELSRTLWPLAFPGRDFDDESTLPEIYEIAAASNQRRTGEVLREELEVNPRSLPEMYHIWFSFPWYRMYTLNVDDLDEAVSRQFDLPRPLKSVSALTSDLPPFSTDSLSIHLNGRVREYPETTFTNEQYGERTAYPDPWYRHLLADLLGRPVLFVGTQLNEPPLWHHLQLRRGRGPRGTREHRPASYLVTPHLSTGRQAVLERLNVDWIEMDVETFTIEVLAELAESRAAGLDALAKIAQRRRPPVLQRVADLRNEPVEDLREFVLGRYPEWADLTNGYAILREFERDLPKQTAAAAAQVLILSGTAGTGKSTTLKRLCLIYEDEGQKVLWLHHDTDVYLHQLRQTVREADIDVLAIDDADVFGSATGPLLADLAVQNPRLLLLATIRSSRFEGLDIAHYLNGVKTLEITVPSLQDSDISLLLDSLHRAKRLGRLANMGRPEQERVFRDYAGRQLLVAMIEATSGRKFEEMIDDECRDLGRDRGPLYATVAMATQLRHYLMRDEILLAMNDVSNEMMHRLQSLLDRHLLVARSGQIRVRHRVLAERAVTYFRREGQIGEAIKGLMYVMATKADPSLPRHTREWQFLIALLNHEFIRTHIDSQAAAREAYAAVEELLERDYHYWLQRGSYELQWGDVYLAKNFLEQARALAGDDYRVQTAWSYMTLKMASQDPAAVDASDRVEEALTELEDAIRRRGTADSYPYHVLGSQGLGWVKRAILAREERIALLERLRSIVREGRRNHPRSRDLEQLAHDLETAYLLEGTRS